MTVPRIVITPKAAAVLKALKERYGPVLFHQSGGCCDGSVPLCLRQHEFRLGARDKLLDVVDETPFYVDDFHFPFLADGQLVLDVIPSQGDSFSLESVDELKFVTRSACAVEGR
jgi:uncharacterized protein